MTNLIELVKQRVTKLNLSEEIVIANLNILDNNPRVDYVYNSLKDFQTFEVQSSCQLSNFEDPAVQCILSGLPFWIDLSNPEIASNIRGIWERNLKHKKLTRSLLAAPIIKRDTWTCDSCIIFINLNKKSGKYLISDDQHERILEKIFSNENFLLKIVNESSVLDS